MLCFQLGMKCQEDLEFRAWFRSVKNTGKLIKTGFIKAFCHLCSEIWIKISK